MTELPQLVMVRMTLDDIPDVSLPEGYSVRHYRDGDEDRLTPVFQTCFDPGWNRDRVCKTFMEQVLWSPQRMLVLCHGDEIIGTATAWEDPRRRGWALLHFVAVVGHHAGQGLGFALVCRTLGLMKSFGYEAAWLTTDDFRLAAILVYLRAGFVPAIDHPSDPQRWEMIRHKLIAAGKDPDLLPEDGCEP